MDSRIDLFKILKNEEKLTNVSIFPAYESIADPYEKNRETNLLNPITIKAYVMPLSFQSLRWKYYGNLPMGSKQIIARKRDKNLFINAHRIKIGNDYYKCYSDDQQGFALKEYENYIVVIVEWKNV